MALDVRRVDALGEFAERFGRLGPTIQRQQRLAFDVEAGEVLRLRRQAFLGDRQRLARAPDHQQRLGQPVMHAASGSVLDVEPPFGDLPI